MIEAGELGLSIDSLHQQLAEDVIALTRLALNLSGLISEHHAHGVFDEVLVGDQCPVCAEAGFPLIKGVLIR